MNSPLKSYEELLKEFKVEDFTDDEVKIGFVRAQIQEHESALFRELVDTIKAQYQVDNAKEDIVKSQHQQKVSEHKLLARQFVRTLEVLKEFKSELEPKISK